MNVSSRLPKFLSAAGGIVFVLALVIAATIPVAAAPQFEMHKVYVTNVREGTFTVTWTTDEPSDGIVRYGTTPALGSVASDPVSGVATHEVNIGGLLPSTTYYFEVESNNGTIIVVDDNGGSYYTVTTGPILGTTPPNPKALIWGYVYMVDGSTPAPYTLIYMRVRDDDNMPTLGDSQWFSTRSDANGVWGYTLGTDRRVDLGGTFIYTDDVDLLQIVGQGGPNGVFGEIGSEFSVFVPGLDTRLDLSLISEPTAISAHSFSANDGQVRQWIAPVLAGLLLAVLALLGMQLRLAERKA